MSSATVICIFGISGVGKTTLVRRVLEGDGDWQHYQASDLIKQGLGDESVTSESLRRASGDEVLANQMILVESFWRRFQASECQNAILDGHLLIDSDKSLVEVPLKVIEQLNVSMLMHIEDKPEKILQRRASDSRRSRPKRSLDALARHQSLSSDLCCRYGRNLGIPVEEFSPFDHVAMRNLLDTFTVSE